MNRISMLLTALLCAPYVAAQHTEAGPIHIESPWSMALPPVSQNGAVYVTIVNSGQDADLLLSATSPIAERVEFHTHAMKEGMMSMRAVESIDLPPGQTVTFEAGERHIMLIGLKRPLVEGDRFPLTLTFARAPTANVEVTVRAAGAPHSGEMTGA